MTQIKLILLIGIIMPSLCKNLFLKDLGAVVSDVPPVYPRSFTITQQFRVRIPCPSSILSNSQAKVLLDIPDRVDDIEKILNKMMDTFNDVLNTTSNKTEAGKTQISTLEGLAQDGKQLLAYNRVTKGAISSVIGTYKVLIDDSGLLGGLISMDRCVKNYTIEDLVGSKYRENVEELSTRRSFLIDKRRSKRNIREGQTVIYPRQSHSTFAHNSIQNVNYYLDYKGHLLDFSGAPKPPGSSQFPQTLGDQRMTPHMIYIKANGHPPVNHQGDTKDSQKYRKEMPTSTQPPIRPIPSTSTPTTKKPTTSANLYENRDFYQPPDHTNSTLDEALYGDYPLQDPHQVCNSVSLCQRLDKIEKRLSLLATKIVKKATVTVCTTDIFGDNICNHKDLDTQNPESIVDSIVQSLPSGKNSINSQKSTRTKRDTNSSQTNKLTDQVDTESLSSISHAPLQPIPKYEGGVWNIALNTDLNDLRGMVNDINSNAERQMLLITQNEQNILAIAHGTDRKFDLLSKKIAKLSEDLERQYNDIYQEIGKIQKDNQFESWRISAIGSLQTILTRLTYINNVINTLSDKLFQYAETYKTFIHAIHHSVLPEDMVSSEMVQKAISNIQKIMLEGYEISGGGSESHFFKSNSAKISQAGIYIVFEYEIPISPTKQKFEVVKVDSVPLLLDKVWVQLSINNMYYIVFSNTETWIALTADEYLACRSSPYSACIRNFPIITESDDLCVLDPYLRRKESNDRCTFSRLTSNSSRYYLKNTGDCSWLVSTGPNEIQYSKTCSNDILNEPSVGTGILKNVNSIQLKSGCTLANSLFTIQCPKVLNLKPIQHENRVLDISDIDNNELDIAPITTLIDQLKLPKMDIKVKKANFSDTLFEHDTINITNLLRKDAVQQIQFLDEKDKIRHFLDEATGTYAAEDRSWFTWFLPSFKTILIWYSVIASTVSILLIGILFKRNGIGGLASAIPLSHRTWSIPVEMFGTLQTLTPPESMSSPIKLLPNLSHVNNSVTANITKALNNTISSHIQLLTENHNSIWIVSVIFLVLHIILAIILAKHIRKSNLMSEIRHGYIPKNKKTIHHIGEVKLCLSVLVEFRSFLNKTAIKREVILQLCTLVRSYDEWYCVKKSPNGTLILANNIKRISRYWDIKLKWGEYCIKSTKSPQLDTCQELPNQIRVCADEMMAQLDDLRFPAWTSCVPVDIVRIFLVGKGQYYRELYNACNPNDISETLIKIGE